MSVAESVAEQQGGVEPIGGAQPLHVRLGDDLKRRLRTGEWGPGDQLPTEAELTAQYQLSRATVRMSMKLLQAQGLTQTRHGAGTFVTAYGAAIRAGLQELRSLTETIAEQGHEPGMDYRTVEFRPAKVTEAGRLERPVGSTVLALERAVLSDGQVVAFSYDWIPIDLLPDNFRPEEMTGSTFAFLEGRAGIRAVHAVAELHTVRVNDVGWDDAKVDDGRYLLLDQVHFDVGGRPVMHSCIYFIEGRFQFMILRTR
jgi:GntR family transcriptional regulator